MVKQHKGTKAMNYSDKKPRTAQRVKVIAHYKDSQVITVNMPVSTSVSLATLLGTTIGDDAIMVWIQNNDSSVPLYYNPTSTASITSFRIQPTDGHTAFGSKTILDQIRLFSTSAISISIMVRVINNE